jgi:hypothetical protein
VKICSKKAKIALFAKNHVLKLKMDDAIVFSAPKNPPEGSGAEKALTKKSSEATGIEPATSGALPLR